MEIRAFVAADAAACAALLTQAGKLVPAVELPEFHRVTQAEEILIAGEADAVVGFLSLYRPDRFIHHLYVSPDHWRRGVGRALLAAALARLDGVAMLKCQEHNRAARAFYRRLDWTERPGGVGAFGAWLWLDAPKTNGRLG